MERVRHLSSMILSRDLDFAPQLSGVLLSRVSSAIFASLVIALGVSGEFRRFNQGDWLQLRRQGVRWAGSRSPGSVAPAVVKQELARNFTSKKNLHYASVDDSVLKKVLKDHRKRLSVEFQVPDELKTSVGFWLKIYTQYSSQQMVIYDGNHMDVIYGTIDLRPLAEKSKNAVLYEITSNRLVERTIKKYRAAFLHLAQDSRPKSPSPEQQSILTALKRLDHRHSFQELSRNLKVMRGQRDAIINGLVAAEDYFPRMEAIFRSLNVPVELIRLCLVESSFNMKAYSRVGAAGIWQFMPPSGRMYLTVDPHGKMDERLSPLKSTVAAAKHLKWNYKYLGSWPLAIISYNHGIRGLPRFRGGDYHFDRIKHLFKECVRQGEKSSLGWASRNYYSEFLAVLLAETYRNDVYGSVPDLPDQPIVFTQLNTPMTGLQFVEQQHVDLDLFRTLNADVRDLRHVLPKGYWLALPSKKEDLSDLVRTVLKASRRSKHNRA